MTARIIRFPEAQWGAPRERQDEAARIYILPVAQNERPEEPIVGRLGQRLREAKARLDRQHPTR